MVAVIAVALHIYHGLWSALQTLGVNRPPTSEWRRGVAAAVAVLIGGGYVAIPLAVLAGAVR
jgi:succinate dehydrogenase / fumarate reductase cytochrome b subunit